MPPSAEGKSATFATRYKQMQERLLVAKAGTIEDQLAKAERDAPELHAAFATLALLLRQEVARLDAGRDDSIIRMLPRTTIVAALNSPLLRIDRDYLCEALNRWCARVNIERFRQGVLEEPCHFCDD